LKIYPSGIFNKIPFHTLVLKQTENPKEWDDIVYLNDKYNITYIAGIDDQASMTDKSQPSKIAVFCFSDQNTIHKTAKHIKGFRELQDAYDECKHIESLFGNRVILYMGENATKENFISVYNDTSIGLIHIATHGNNNSDEFDNSVLYFRSKNGKVDSLLGVEILNQQPTGKSIILASCESAQGKIIEHQNTYSLARYFLINGANHVASSLWEIDDKSSKGLYYKLYEKWAKKGYLDIKDINQTNPNHRFGPYFSHSQLVISN
jgi:CHAT domain-containing protein